MTVHMLRDRKGNKATTRCRASVKPAETTVWESEVTCPECVYKPPSDDTEAFEATVEQPRKRVIPRYALEQS